MSRLMRKPTICICENKDADQLRGYREADQRLCFGYTDSTIPLLSKSKISSLYPSSVTVQASLCRTWSETTVLVFPRGGSNVKLMHVNSRAFLFPSDLQLELEYWAETGEFDEDELHEVIISLSCWQEGVMSLCWKDHM